MSAGCSFFGVFLRILDYLILLQNVTHEFNLSGQRLVYIFPLLFSILSLMISMPVSAEDCLVPDKVYQEVSHCILSGYYTDAEKIMDDFITGNPDEPAGPLLKAAILQYQSTDYEDYSREKEFLALIDKVDILTRKKLEQNGNDLWARYYLAAADGIKGVWIVSSGKFVRGVYKGRSGAKGMECIIASDSTFYDAYLLLGSYLFWKNTAMERISWLPFIETPEDEGIREVKTAISHGRLTGPLANTVLLEILLDHDPEQAMKVGEKMAGEYPLCRLFAWQLGEAYKKLKRYDDAVRIFTGIAASMEKDSADDGSGELRCWWKLAVLSKTIGKTGECKYYCNKIVELGKRDSVYRRQQKRITGAINMLKTR